MDREYGIQDEKIMQTGLWWEYLIQEGDHLEDQWCGQPDI